MNPAAQHPEQALLNGLFTGEAAFRDAYSLGPFLGSGSYGHVFACTEKDSGAEYACKMILKTSLRTDEAWENLQREASLMGVFRNRHPHIVQMREVVETQRAVHVIMEQCNGGDLFDLLQARGRLPEPAAKLVFRQVASALAFCHSLGVVHRDIKPENILLDRPAFSLYKMTSPCDVSSSSSSIVQAKLADFGLSDVLQGGRQLKGFVGSLRYKAPEEVRGRAHGAPADVWSLGVVLYAMLSGCLPFSGRNHEDAFGLRQAIMRASLRFTHKNWSGVSDEAKDLVCRMLQLDPAKRPTAEEVLSFSWVAQETPAAKSASMSAPESQLFNFWGSEGKATEAKQAEEGSSMLPFFFEVTCW